jgi:predicted transport protein
VNSIAARLLCIAGDFTKYDEHAVQQIERNIELLRYRRYGADLLLLELVNASSAESAKKHGAGDAGKERHQPKATEASPIVQDLWKSLKAFLLALGDDVQMKELENYIAFRRLKNFACVQVRRQDVLIWAKLDPSSIEQEPGFTRDVAHLGHAGTETLRSEFRTAQL